MTGESLLTIGEVARRAGVRSSTLRYYDDEGLVVPSARVGGRRRYAAAAVEQLATIRFLPRARVHAGRDPRQPGGARGRPEGALPRPRRRQIAELDAAAARAGAMAEVLRVSRDGDCVDVSECASRAAECGEADGPRQD